MEGMSQLQGEGGFSPGPRPDGGRMSRADEHWTIEAAATAASLVVTTNGAVSVKTTALLTPETVDCQTPGT